MAKKSGCGCLGTIVCLIVIVGMVRTILQVQREAEVAGPPANPTASRPDGKSTGKAIAENKSVSPVKSATQTPVVPISSARRVSADDLINAYSANEVAADQRYKGERMAVVGYVESINKNIIGTDMYVVLSGSDDSAFISVQCFFNKKHEDALASIRKGDIYIITGRCAGLFINVAMRDCDLVELPPPEVNETEVRAREQAQKKTDYEEKMRAAREVANLKQREKSQQNRPAIAANDLRLAQTFLENGDRASYLRLLRKIVAQYPETSAATEAKTLLGE